MDSKKVPQRRIKLNTGSTKRLPVMVCMSLLILIDWTRGSQGGEVWRWTVNMTAVLVTLLVMAFLGFRSFCRKVYLIWLVLGPVFAGGAYLFWFRHQTAGYYWNETVAAAVGLWALGFLYIRLLVDVLVEKSRKLHPDPLAVLLFGILILAFLSRNEDLWPLYFLLTFLPVYLMLPVVEESKLSEEALPDALILMFFILQGLSFVFRPFDDPGARYSGFYANPNQNALFYAMIYVAFLLRSLEGKRKVTRILATLFAAAMWGFVFLTGCRTALLALFGVSVLFVIFGRFFVKREKALPVFGRLLIFLLVAVLAFPIDYAAVRYLPPLFHHPIWFQSEYSEEKVHSWDPWDSEKYVSFDEVTAGITERISPILEKLGQRFRVQAAENVVIAVEPTLDSTRIRFGFWQYYLRTGTLWGHSNEEGHTIPGMEWYGYVWHTQNLFLQFWYYYGIPVAILLAIWLLWVLAWALLRTLKGDRAALPVLLFETLFVLYGMPEAVWYPGQFILFLAFFMPVLLCRKRT